MFKACRLLFEESRVFFAKLPTTISRIFPKYSQPNLILLPIEYG